MPDTRATREQAMQADGELARVLAVVLPAGAGVPEDGARLDALPGMDSLKFMALVSALEEAVGGEVNLEALAEVETVGDVRRMLAGA
jgi:acyl carrier protein